MELGELRTRLNETSRVVAFTGAGVSTESGIADYRGKGGVWTQYRVVTIQEFLSSDEGRAEYWRRKQELWPSVRDALPNEGHKALGALFERGILKGLITQNIDGLHQRGGVPDDAIVELHGNGLQTSCLECGSIIATGEAIVFFQNTGNPPACADCGGWMKPATISFGQAMPELEMKRAAQFCDNADIFIAAGSSLAVHPAASFPVIAKQGGALLVIINRNETALDDVADVVLRGETGDILSQLAG